MIRCLSAGGGATGGTDTGSASAATRSVGHVLAAHGAAVEVRLEAGELVVGQRAEQVGADGVGPVLVIGGGRLIRGSPALLPSAWRIFSSPSRMRPLTVPTGVSSIVGDLRVGEAAEVGQLDHLALLGREVPEGVAHRARLLVAGGLDVRALAGLQSSPRGPRRSPGASRARTSAAARRCRGGGRCRGSRCGRSRASARSARRTATG